MGLVFQHVGKSMQVVDIRHGDVSFEAPSAELNDQAPLFWTAQVAVTAQEFEAGPDSPAIETVTTVSGTIHLTPKREIEVLEVGLDVG